MRAKRLLLHFLISTGIACLAAGYPFLMLSIAKGEDSLGYLMLLYFIAWPVGNLVGGAVSVRVLRLAIGARRFALLFIPFGALGILIGTGTCVAVGSATGASGEMFAYAIGGAFLPLVSVGLASFFELSREAE